MNALINYHANIAASNVKPYTTINSRYKKTLQGKTILHMSSNIDGMPVSASIVFDNRILTLSTVASAENTEEALKQLEQIITTAVTVNKKEDLCTK